MNKEQFIAYMNKKLSIIKEDERKDIIDEYINHIEMKVAEGKTEEEAIADFGDIDEMINEILEAYNIDPKQTRGNGYDHKVNDILDRLFEGLQSMISSMTSLDMDNVVRLIFEVLVVLILLGLLRIPFEIVASIGDSLLDSLFGFGIFSAFGWIWKLMVRLLYIVVFFVALINIFRKRWSHYRGHMDEKPIMDEFKESFNFEQAKEAVHRFTQGNEKAQKKEHIYKDEEDIASDMEEDIQHEFARNSHYEEKSYAYQGGHPRSNNASISDGVFSVTSVILKIFGFLFMLPFIGIMISLCIGLGFLIVMSFQGITFWGIYLIVCGAITGVSAVLSLIYRFLCKGGRA